MAIYYVVIVYFDVTGFGPYEFGKTQNKRKIDVRYETRHELVSYDKIEPNNDEKHPSVCKILIRVFFTCG
ncbi:MAG: hypothetical protein WCQ47_07865 [bacterium]